MSREENKMQESVANILRLELMDKCNCPSGLEVMFSARAASAVIMKNRSTTASNVPKRMESMTTSPWESSQS